MKKLSKIAIIALTVLIALSSVSLGKVFAYFGAKSSASGSITMGTLSINDTELSDSIATDWNIGNLQPNQSFGGSYSVEVTSDINYYVRVLFKASVTPQAGSTHINGTSCGDYVTDDTDILSISIDGNYSMSTTKTGDGYTAYYKLSPIKVTSKKTTTETFNIDLKVNDWAGCNYCHYYMKANVVVNMRVQVMQADYLEGNSVGGTISSVSEMHTLWSTCLGEPVYYNVSISIVSSGYRNVYYATDGETTWHRITTKDVTLQVAEAIMFTMDNTKAVDWNSVSTTAYNDGEYYVYIRKVGSTSGQELYYTSDAYSSQSEHIYSVVGFVIEQDEAFEVYYFGNI